MTPWSWRDWSQPLADLGQVGWRIQSGLWTLQGQTCTLVWGNWRMACDPGSSYSAAAVFRQVMETCLGHQQQLQALMARGQHEAAQIAGRQGDHLREHAERMMPVWLTQQDDAQRLVA